MSSSTGHNTACNMPALRASVLLLLLGAVWLALSALANEPRLQINVEGGRYVFEPASIRLRIRVEPDAENRALTVALLSEGYETSSLEELHGVRAARTRWVEYKAVPAGSYDVEAVVHRPSARAWRASGRLVVLARH